MPLTNTTEVWLQGPLPGIQPALQPVAHALLQAGEEMTALMQDFPAILLWQRPAGVASAGFHVQHMTGVVDRLFTYAKGQPLNEWQLQQLAAEGNPGGEKESVQSLVRGFNKQVDRALYQLKNTAADALFETRGVGRAQIPATVLGLLVHAAEHTMRHLGQLLVTVSVVRMDNK